MSRLNPYFEVEGKKYEIIRTPYLECEYDKIKDEENLSPDEERVYSEYLKFISDYKSLVERFEDVKEDYFSNITSKVKKDQYKAFEQLVNEKYSEMTEFLISHKEFNLNHIQDITYSNGKKILIAGLCERYKLSEKEASDIWCKFENHLGKQTAYEWIEFMLNSLFGKEEDEDDPFLKQARAKAQQAMEQRKGLAKVRR